MVYSGQVRSILLIPFVIGLSLSCASRRPAATFRVLPAQPDYLLRSPDAKDTPFMEILSRYSSGGQVWVDLRPRIELRVENAYFREGTTQRVLANYLGTEVARYHSLPTGALEQSAVQAGLAQRPAGQPAVQDLLSASQMRYPHHRFFYQVLVNQKANIRSAVWLSAESVDELERLTQQLLSEPEAVCQRGSRQCTVFPESCTAALEIGITVNDVERSVLWGDGLANVAFGHQHVELFRLHDGRLTPVAIDPNDPRALGLPLLPGDRVKWRDSK